MRGFHTGLAFCAASLGILLATPALATTKQNIELISKHFATLGTVRYQVFAELGGPEVGVAEIGGKLHVVQVEGRGVKSLLSEPFTSTGTGAAFRLMGETDGHLLTYNASELTDEHGNTHVRGDVIVRNIDTRNGGTVTQLFELRNAIDAGFDIGSWKFQDNFIRQPALHFLNTGERLPRRSLYSRLLWDPVSGQYKLGHFLTALPNAGTVQADNTNNRAILFYRAGHLREAAALFSQATTQADSGQSIVAHNNDLVSIEINDLASQGRNFPGQPFDEALSLYWQGEYADALASLALRGDAVTEFDYALRGLALAQERRWIEVDENTEVLARKSLSANGRGREFYADYLGELVTIALLQGKHMQQVATRYLTALEATDKGHPAYVRGITALMQRLGKTTESQKVLEDYIRIAPGDADLSDLRLMLFELYQNTGQPTTQLIAEAQRGPLHNIAGYVDLIDYYDLRSALTTVEYEGEFYEINGPLDKFGLTDSRQDGEYTPPVPELPQPESGIIKGTSK